MNFKALITTLVLGSSSIALADPSWSGGVSVQGNIGMRGDHDGDADDYVRDHRVPLPVYQPAPAPLPIYQPELVQLVQPTRLLRRHVKTFSLGANSGFSRLEVKADRGETRVYELEITFADGQKQVVRTDRLLNANMRGERSMTVALKCRAPISRIEVEGKTGPIGIFSILAA